MRNLLIASTVTTLLFASTSIWAQESEQDQDKFTPRVYGSMDAGKSVQKASTQTQVNVSDAELERVIEEAARRRAYEQGVQDATRAFAKKAETSDSKQAHTVKKGETLYNLSKRYNVKISEIRSANNLAGNKIDLGQKLTIPSATPTLSVNTTVTQPLITDPQSSRSGTTLNRVVLPAQTNTDTIYAVLPKDTLYGISRRSCVKVEDLIVSNEISNPNALKPGQKLTLPEGHCLSR